MKSSEIVRAIGDYIIPRFCTSCKNKLELTENVLCTSCFEKIVRIDKDFLLQEEQKSFSDSNISAFLSAFLFTEDSPLKILIHSFKYENKFRNAQFLGELASKILLRNIKALNINFIHPVPLHKIKKAERGYNQSFYICKGISKITKIPTKRDLFVRHRFTPSQTMLNKKERKENIKSAFKIKKPKLVFGKNILLVDDVKTTGATLNECANILKSAGANEIFALTSAIAE